MIYYPLTTLLLAGCDDILIVTAPEVMIDFELFLGDGSKFGVSITYLAQPEPLGVSDALAIAETFVAKQSFFLILGDNLFFSSGLSELLSRMKEGGEGIASVLTFRANDPERFGVIEFDQYGNVTSIVEKPKIPPSDRVVTGLYFLPGDAPQIASELEPSSRGEVEITDLLNFYIASTADFRVFDLPRGAIWYDAGTIEAMYNASEFVRSYQLASGCLIGCPEEVAIGRGLVSAEHVLKNLASSQSKSPYVQYIKSLSK